MKNSTKFLWLIACFIICLSANAQFTSVTGTATDLDGQTWNNGTWSVTLYNQFSQSPASINGTPLTASQLNQHGSLNNSGALSVSLADNSIVAPTGTYWIFTICPNASSQCAIINSPVSGGSLDISSVISTGLKGPRFSANSSNGGAFGYLDSEVYPTPNPGGEYYSVTQACKRIWSGSSWSCLNGATSFALQVGGTNVPTPGNIQNSSTVTWSLVGSIITATASPVTTGCNPAGTSGTFLLDNGSHGCISGPMVYSGGTLTTTATNAVRNISSTDTLNAVAQTLNLTGNYTLGAAGITQSASSGIAHTDNSSSGITIHEVGTSNVAITADNGNVNLTGTGINVNSSPACSQATGCTAKLAIAINGELFNTTYQNSGTAMISSGYGHINGGSGDSTITCSVGATSGLGTIMYSETMEATALNRPVAFIFPVPSSYFYRCDVTNLINTTPNVWNDSHF